MKIVQVTTVTKVSDDLSGRILARLKKNLPVLFLVSGGSTVNIAIEVCRAVLAGYPGKKETLKWLFTISQIDERFGPAGHQDSNWQLLLNHGFQSDLYSVLPILRDNSASREAFDAAVSRFNLFLNDAVHKRKHGNLFITGLFGIGPDGHTAGILPETPASSMELSGSRLAAGYKSALFTRITVAPAFFQYIDYAAVYVSGAEKQQVLESLQNELPVTEQPAQLLKQTAETVIYTDIDLTTEIDVL